LYGAKSPPPEQSGVSGPRRCSIRVVVQKPGFRALLEDRHYPPPAPERQLTAYAITLGLVGLVSVAGFYMMQHHLARIDLAMLCLLRVVVRALRFGRGPAIFSAVSGSIVFARFFIPPFWTAGLNDVWYLITFITLLVVGLVISALTSHAREETRKARN